VSSYHVLFLYVSTRIRKNQLGFFQNTNTISVRIIIIIHIGRLNELVTYSICGEIEAP
jgi:hypothetical protein